MNAQGQAALGGRIRVRKLPGKPNVFLWHCRNWLEHRWREIPQSLFVACLPLLRVFFPALCVLHSHVRLVKRCRDGTVIDFGIVGRHLVVTAGKNYLAACFDNTNEAENLKYHGFGTGTTAAAAGDTGLQTELTTQYATDNTRPTGTQSKSTNTYTTVGTLSPDATVAITEWGLFSASSSTTLFDRQVFSAVNMVSGDSLAVTYVLTIS